MNRIAFFVVTLVMVLLSSMATAEASALLLTDMNAMECKVLEDPAFWRCDIWYEKARIYAGRDVGPENANGDCVICRNVRAYAQKNQLNVILNRDLNWDHPDLLMFTADDTLSSIFR